MKPERLSSRAQRCHGDASCPGHQGAAEQSKTVGAVLRLMRKHLR